MIHPRALILTGYGINCDEETQFAFEQAGAHADITHVNDLISRQRHLSNYQMLAFPGGFSYGDDTGSGNGLANRIRNNLWDEVLRFVEGDHLVLGVCNGFQVLVRLGLLPALDDHYGTQQVSLLHNDGARYLDRWVDLNFSHHGPWLHDIPAMSLPIAHGEGKLYAPQETLTLLRDQGLVAARYVSGEICTHQSLSANPNGSLDDIAGLTDTSGRVFGLMPHPERAIRFTHLPHWTYLKERLKREGREIPSEGQGIQIFKNGVHYFT